VVFLQDLRIRRLGQLQVVLQGGGESTLQVYIWMGHLCQRKSRSFEGGLELNWCRGSITAIWRFVTLSDRVLQNWSSPTISLVLRYSVEVSTTLRWQKTCKCFIHLNFFLFPTLYWHHLITWGFDTHSWSDGCVSYHVYCVMTYFVLVLLLSTIIEVFLLTPLSLTSSWVRAKLERIYFPFAKGVSWREHLQWRSLWMASEQIFCYHMTLVACDITFVTSSFLFVSLRIHWLCKSAVSGLSIPALFLAFSYQYRSVVLYVLFERTV
jgi:hypothetical protein